MHYSRLHYTVRGGERGPKYRGPGKFLVSSVGDTIDPARADRSEGPSKTNAFKMFKKLVLAVSGRFRARPAAPTPPGDAQEPGVSTAPGVVEIRRISRELRPKNVLANYF